MYANDKWPLHLIDDGAFLAIEQSDLWIKSTMTAFVSLSSLDQFKFLLFVDHCHTDGKILLGILNFLLVSAIKSK